MEILYTQEEIHRLEVYGEYLKKIPDLLKQLETVEKMYQKAAIEEKMIAEDDSLTKECDYSKKLYSDRLSRIKKQCVERAADIKEQSKLILKLKEQIESESTVLKAVMEKRGQG